MARKKRPSRASAHRKLIYRHRKLYDVMLENQHGVCAICGRPPGARRLAIDHDHKTMKVRGLLCYRCNTMLRNWITPNWLYGAALYLEDPPFDYIDVESVEGDTT